MWLFRTNPWFIVLNLMTRISLALVPISVAISVKLKIALPYMPNYIKINHNWCWTTSILLPQDLLYSYITFYINWTHAPRGKEFVDNDRNQQSTLNCVPAGADWCWYKSQLVLNYIKTFITKPQVSDSVCNKLNNALLQAI